MKNFEKLLGEAIQRRSKLTLASDAMRLVNGVGDGLDGLLIDRYNKHFQVQFLADHWHKQTAGIQRFFSNAFPVDYLIIKSRQGLDIKAEVLLGSQAQTVVEEHGIKFAVDLNEGLNCGLFLDMRANRKMAGAACKDKKVLNCFAYTCAFGVHSKANGAGEVVNVDISRKILERGKNNYQLNGLPFADAEFVKADSLFFLQRALKKGNNFDVIILDPPSFARHEGETFQVKRDLPELLALAVAVLNPQGQLLVTTNFSELTYTELARMLTEALQGRTIESSKRVGQDKDFYATNSFKESYLAGLWVKFL